MNCSLLGVEAPGLAEMVFGCIQGSDIDNRLTLYANIVLRCGGGGWVLWCCEGAVVGAALLCLCLCCVEWGVHSLCGSGSPSIAAPLPMDGFHSLPSTTPTAPHSTPLPPALIAAAAAQCTRASRAA